MSDQLKIAQMNTKAVLAKLAEYEQRHAEQEARVARAEAQVVALSQQVQAMQALLARSLAGSGPTSEGR